MEIQCDANFWAGLQKYVNYEATKAYKQTFIF